MAWTKWLCGIGGLIAVVGQWVPEYYLPVIGGVIAIVGALIPE